MARKGVFIMPRIKDFKDGEIIRMLGTDYIVDSTVKGGLRALEKSRKRPLKTHPFVSEHCLECDYNNRFQYKGTRPFRFFTCKRCGKLNYEWVINNHKVTDESRMRALFLEFIIRENNEVVYVAFINEYNRRYPYPGSDNEDKLRATLNNFYIKYSNHHRYGGGLHMHRHPKNKLAEQCYDSILFEGDPQIFFNHTPRFVRPWDLMHLDADTLSVIREIMTSHGAWENLEHWLWAVDHFIERLKKDT